jgi:6-pyruvoyltetrahydropterin/6-carboxytetrahydropterin synthase
MFEITKEIEFDAGHRVPLHESKCRNPHGHRYRIVAHVEGELITEGPESGMVRDFSIIKELLTTVVHDRFDHGFIVAESDANMRTALDADVTWKVIVVPFFPTAENLAKAIYEDLQAEGLSGLRQIDVWETPTSCAKYQEE